MARLASFLAFLALLVGLAGLVSFYLTYRPSELRDWTAAALDFGAVALSGPWVPAAAATAIVATVLARLLDRPPAVERSRRVHTLPSSPWESLADSGLASETEKLRLRLRAALRGRSDDVARFVDELLNGALSCRASDVHVQPREGFARISLRVEGDLVDVATAEEDSHARIVRRLKVLAHLVPYKTHEAQDGRFSLRTPTSASGVDVRVSVLPTQHGEKVVLRFLKPGAELLEIGDLGMDAEARSAFEKVLEEPQGLVVLTGPTGSGKTTTLYSALSHIHRTRGSNTQIASIEDPVEIDLPFLAQTQVDRARNLDFSAGLRSVLRQDPNVLMVGEIRDAETAGIAVQAGLSGHLILTSLHAESAAGVFARLIDMGSEPFLVASSTLACVSQRLVRLLCPDCRRPARVDRKTAARLAERGVSPETAFFRSEGCRACDDRGVQGRTAIFELLRVTPELRRRIASGVPTQEIEAAAAEAGMRTLRRAAVEMAAAGRIGPDELLRIAG